MEIKKRIISAAVLVHLLGASVLPVNLSARNNVYAAANVTVMEDFEGTAYVPDSDPPIKANGTGVQNGLKQDNPGDFKVRQDSTQQTINKYLEVGRTAWSGTKNTNENRVVVFRRGVPYISNIHAPGSVYVFEFDCKGTGSNATRRFVNLSRVLAEVGGLCIDENGKICAWEWSGSTKSFVDSGVSFQMNQWNHFKMLFNTTTLTYEIYYNNSADPVVTASFGSNPYFKDTAILDIQGFFVDMQLVTTTAAENAFTDLFCVDNFTLSQLEPLSVQSTVPAAGSKEVSCKPAITVKHNFPIDSSSLASAVVKVDGTEDTAATVTAQAGDKTACTVTLGSTLTKNTEYTVTVSGIKDIYGRSCQTDATLTFTTKDSYLEIGAPKYYKNYADASNPGTELTALEAVKVTGVVSLDNASADETYPVSVFMGLFKKADDSLVNIAYGTGSIAPGSGSVTAAFDVTGSANDYYIKTFVWDGVAGMKAYTDQYTFAGTETAATGDIGHSPVNASVNHEQKTVAVSGTLADGEKGVTTLLVLRPEKTAADITAAAVKDVVEYIGQSKTNASGGYIFNYALNENALQENKAYSVILGGTNVTTKKETTFKYFGSGTINAVLAAIESADSAAIGTYLADPPTLINGTIDMNEILKLDLTDYRALGHQSPVHDALAGKAFSRTDDVKTAFNGAVAIQKAIDAVQAGPVSSMTSILRANNALLGLDLDNAYGYKSLEDKKTAGTSDAIDIVHTEIMKEYELAKLQAAFRKQVVLQAVNAATRNDMQAILENNADLNLSFTAFNALDSDDRTLVLQRMVEDYTFTELTAVKTAFDYEVSRLTTPAVTPGAVTGRPSTGATVSKIEVSKENKEQNVPGTADFADIADVPWAQEGIRALREKGIIDGKGGNQFAPHDALTKEQLVKILVLAFDLYDEWAEAEFSDVSSDAWYYRYVASAKKYGIVTGSDDGSFGVDKTVTRQEMAAMLYRAAGQKGMNLSSGEPQSFADGAEIDAYAAEAVNALSGAEILAGVGDGRFAPREATTRAMAAKVVYGILQLQ